METADETCLDIGPDADNLFNEPHIQKQTSEFMQQYFDQEPVKLEQTFEEPQD